MKHISFDKLQKEKKSVKEFDKDLFNIKNQINLINQIYLENEIQEKPLILREIQNKIMSYKHQDIEKNILPINYS